MKVINKKITKRFGIFYVSSEKESKYTFATSKLKDLKNNRVASIRNNEFIITKSSKINFISLSPNQMISIGTGLIPFLEHDDANRALMGSNMQRQAMPLLKKEVPIVGTGTETKIAKDSQLTIVAKKSGQIMHLSHRKILVFQMKNKFGKNNLYTIKKSLINKIKSNIVEKKIFKYFKKTKYLLGKERKSNQNTQIKQTASIKKKEWVKKGQIIAEGNGTLKGELSLGKNILIAYMTWKGYNFEDAIVISERLRTENLFTSIHTKKYKTYLIKNEINEEKLTILIPNIRLKNLINLKKNGIIKVGSIISNEAIIVGKIRNKPNKTINSKLLTTIFQRNIIKDISLKLPKGIKGTVTRTSIARKKNLYSITIYINEKRKIQIGDKIAGRHGNKGIVSRILPIEDMPYIQDGTPIDMLLNPLGIPSRMNVGQILECLLGLASKNLNEKYRILPFNESEKGNISTQIVYNKLNEARRKTNKKWLFSANFPGKMKIINGMTGEVFKQPVTVGYAYMLKLMHLVEDKINARLTGPYSLILKQPIRGKAKKGGQRFGEMEVWALEGFGSAYILQELLTIKSDDLTNRSKALIAIMKGTEIPKPSIPESLKTLILELQCLCLKINIYSENTDNFFK